MTIRRPSLSPSLPALLLAAIFGLPASAAPPAAPAAGQPLRIGIPTPIQLQVGRDTQDAAALAIEEINAKGGVLGRKLQMVVADETESPEQGISAIKKLTDEKVDVLVGGYTSGVTLAELPHISAAKTIYLGVGAASPAITAKVKQDYPNYKYIFRANPLNSRWLAAAVVDFVVNCLGKEKGLKKIAIAGESAKWVQDLVPVLKKGIVDGGLTVPMTEFFDVQTSDFSPLFSKAVSSGAQFLVVILSHASSDVFVKQWYDARVPLPIGGIDVKSQDADFFDRVGGKALSETTQIGFMRAAVTPRTIPFWDSFVARYKRNPVYTAGGAYDAIHLYAEAVARAKSVEADAVVKELEKTDFVGTSGRIVFDETHDIRYGPEYVQAMFVQWQEGGKRAVVWPKSRKNGEYILPAWAQK
ncbi:MAG TPA: ABC transporter substrate-binding protein [Myxococcales bacterium]|jgi:branched-chain amino acid transport system substrate-binding protein|nr:ABC transporter substrate-binding protein [Myxococcales bacterium]